MPLEEFQSTTIDSIHKKTNNKSVYVGKLKNIKLTA